MYIVMRYLGQSHSLFVTIGPFPTRADAELYCLDNCGIFGYRIEPLLPVDAKVSVA